MGDLLVILLAFEIGVFTGVFLLAAIRDVKRGE